MKKFFATLLLLLAVAISSTAQKTFKADRNLLLTTSLGYGTENNWGNTGFYAGVGITKPVTKRFALEAGLTYFTTSFYNAYKANPTHFKGEERFYNTVFLQTNLQYCVGNDQSLFNFKIKVGPALKYFDFKAFQFGLINTYSNGRKEPVPGTIKYEIEKGIILSLYNAVSFNAKISPKLRLGVYLDTYSSLIPIEHFMPGISATFKLGDAD